MRFRLQQSGACGQMHTQIYTKRHKESDRQSKRWDDEREKKANEWKKSDEQRGDNQNGGKATNNIMGGDEDELE